MASLIATCAFVIATLIVYRLIKEVARFYKCRRQLASVNGPHAVPLLGNALSFKLDRVEFGKQVKEFNREYGPAGLMHLWFGTRLIIVATRASTVERIFSSNKFIDKSVNYDFLKTWLGDGLLISGGDKWRSRRKMLTPAFHFSILNTFAEVFNEQANILVQKLTEAMDKGSFDIFPYLGRCALDVICETAMGVRINAQKDANSAYVQAVNKMSGIIMHRERKPWLWIKPVFYAMGYGFEYRKCLKVLKDFTKKVVHDRLEENKTNRKPRQETKRLAFLDLLISVKEQEQLEFQDLIDEVDTFMFEGHDTTAAGMSWTVFMLGCHTDHQQKVFEELQEIFGDSDRAVTPDDLKQMKYLDCVIKESLRLFPPVPLISRAAIDDLEIGNITIPKGAIIGIAPYFVHHDKEIYGEDVEEYRPERFFSDEGRSPFAFVPFAAGPRNCIGQKFAQMEEKIVLSNIVRNFHIKSTHKREDVQEVFELILRPHPGVFVTLTPRKSASFL